jgi:hypothetical protein
MSTMDRSAVDESMSRYGWLDDDDRALAALSVTLVELDPAAALDRLGPTRMLPEPMSVAAAGDEFLRTFTRRSLVVQTDRLDRWTVLIEPVGWAGATPEVLDRLSADGQAVNVFWTVNAVMRFGFARGGATVREFDPLLYDDPDGALPEERDLPFGDPGGALAAAFVLAERITVIGIERDWLLDRRRPTYVLPAP